MIKELNAKAKQVCATHYAKQCGNCPLRDACVSPVGPGKENLNAWVDRVNQRAEEIAV